jgi:hypothetical protein
VQGSYLIPSTNEQYADMLLLLLLLLLLLHLFLL